MRNRLPTFLFVFRWILFRNATNKTTQGMVCDLKKILYTTVFRNFISYIQFALFSCIYRVYRSLHEWYETDINMQLIKKYIQFILGDHPIFLNASGVNKQYSTLQEYHILKKIQNFKIFYWWQQLNYNLFLMQILPLSSLCNITFLCSSVSGWLTTIKM